MKIFLQIMVALITVFNFSSLRAEIQTQPKFEFQSTQGINLHNQLASSPQEGGLQIAADRPIAEVVPSNSGSQTQTVDTVSTPQFTPQGYPPLIDATPSQDNDLTPGSPLKTKSGCLLAELVVKHSKNAALVAHYQHILDTQCAGKSSSVAEQCAWLEEHKDSCHKVDVEQISEGTPQDHAIPIPKKKHPKPSCEEYQAWYQQLCVAPPAIPQDPPVPGNKDADAGVTTTPNYALAGGACSLSPAGAPLDAGMVFVLASMIGLFILSRRKS